MKTYGIDVNRRSYRIPEPLNERLDELADETPLNKSQMVRAGIQLVSKAMRDDDLRENIPDRWGQERFLAEELDIESDYI